MAAATTTLVNSTLRRAISTLCMACLLGLILGCLRFHRADVGGDGKVVLSHIQCYLHLDAQAGLEELGSAGMGGGVLADGKICSHVKLRFPCGPTWCTFRHSTGMGSPVSPTALVRTTVLGHGAFNLKQRAKAGGVEGGCAHWGTSAAVQTTTAIKASTPGQQRAQCSAQGGDAFAFHAAPALWVLMLPRSCCRCSMARQMASSHTLVASTVMRLGPWVTVRHQHVATFRCLSVCCRLSC